MKKLMYIALVIVCAGVVTAGGFMLVHESKEKPEKKPFVPEYDMTTDEYKDGYEILYERVRFEGNESDPKYRYMFVEIGLRSLVKPEDRTDTDDTTFNINVRVRDSGGQGEGASMGTSKRLDCNGVWDASVRFLLHDDFSTFGNMTYTYVVGYDL